MTLEEQTPQEIAAQLRKPEGEAGIAIGDLMNKGNEAINLTTYKKLELKDNEHLLEIGMGNGKFIPHTLSLAENLSYTGLDFSKTMVTSAINYNKEIIENGSVSILEGSIEKIPFPEASFDKVCTINTLYFWPNPLENSKELLRVLKPEGKLIVAIRPKEIMDAMEITKYGFTKYMGEDAQKLLIEAGFKNVTFEILEEPDYKFDENSTKLQGCFVIGYK